MRIAFFLTLCTTVALAVNVTLVGCNSPSTQIPNQGSAPSTERHDDSNSAVHIHPTEGPHGGHLIELGDEEYHAELLHDEQTHTVTIHLLDGPATQSVAIPLAQVTLQLLQDGQFTTYNLKAVPGPDNTTVTASQFEIVDEALSEALSHGEETRGRVQVTIDGKPFVGTVEHTPHGPHEDGDDS